MVSADETLQAATAILQGLAVSKPFLSTTLQAAESPQISTGSRRDPLNTPFKLPGEQTTAKLLFEQELAALAHRIHHNPIIDSEQPFYPSPSLPPPRKRRNPCEPVGQTTSDSQLDQSHTISILRGQLQEATGRIETQEAENSQLRKELERHGVIDDRMTPVGEASDVAQTGQARSSEKTHDRDIWEISQAISRIENGHLSTRLPIDISETDSEITSLKRRVNRMADRLGTMVNEVSRVSRRVGHIGDLGVELAPPKMKGDCEVMVQNVNELASTLTMVVREVSSIAAAVTRGRPHTINLPKPRRVGEIADMVRMLHDMLNHLHPSEPRIGGRINRAPEGPPLPTAPTLSRNHDDPHIPERTNMPIKSVISEDLSMGPEVKLRANLRGLMKCPPGEAGKPSSSRFLSLSGSRKIP